MAFRLIRKTSAKPQNEREREAKRALDQIALGMQSASASVFRRKEELDSRARQLRAKRDAREGRATEGAVARAVLQFLAETALGEASVQEIKDALPSYLALTFADQTPSLTRAGEELWIQQIRNIISHREVPGNFIYEGLLTYSAPAKLSITDLGRTALAQTSEQVPAK
jgi:hypothetical protein